MTKLVVFSGAGMSAESGISTFRDSNGLWENYDIQQVATPEAWERNPALVQRFTTNVVKYFRSPAERSSSIYC